MNTRKEGYWESLCQILHDQYFSTGTVVAVAKIQGLVDEKRLRAALQKVHAAQPLLRAKVKTRDHDYYFSIDDTASNTPLIIEEVNPHWETRVENELSFIFSHDSYQWRVHYIKAPEQRLILTAGHNIADGVSIANFFYQVFQTYQDNDLAPSKLTLLPSVEELLTHYDAAKKSDPPKNFVRTPFYYEKNIPLDSRKTKNFFHVISEEDTKKIVARCKSNKISVNDYLNAALLISLAKIRDQTINTTLHTPINLRPLCQPEVTNEYFGCYVSVTPQYFENVKPNSSVITLAKQYGASLKAGLPYQAIYPAEFDAGALKTQVKTWVGSNHTEYNLGACVTNIGVQPFAKQYGDIYWETLHFTTSRNCGDLVLLVNALTLHNQLMLCFTYTEGCMLPATAMNMVNNYIQL